MNVDNLPQIPLDEIEAQFRAFMKDNNCEPLDNISLEMDGQIKRYRVYGDKKSEKTGAYLISIEGYPHGWCQNWREGKPVFWAFNRTNSTIEKILTNDAVKQLIEKSKAHQAEMKSQLQRLQLEASEKARILFETLQESAQDSRHKYLIAKKIYSYGLKLQDNRLVVPLYDIDDNFKSIQWINSDGTKRFFTDAPVKGAFFPIARDSIKSDNAKDIIIFICEGMATGATIHELTTMPVFAAMNCGNLFDVAKALKTKYPQYKIVITADNDHKTKDNPGITTAQKVKDKLDLYGVIYPDFTEKDNGTDWNDYFRQHGEEATRDIIREKCAAIPLVNKQNEYKARVAKLGRIDSEYLSTFCNPIEDANFLIEGWIPTQSIIMMFAPSGSGKGFVAVDIAHAIASPEIDDWHGKKVNKHGPVVYLAGEGQKGLRKRCAGFTHYKNISKEKTQLAFIKEALPLNDSNPEAGVDKVIANIGMLFPNPALVIIDTTNRYMLGDENKTIDATSFIQAATKIANEFKCTVMIVHHTGLNPENQNRARGSSVFKAAMDMEFRISKSGMAITLEMTKSKDTEEQRPLVFEMLQVPAPGFFTDSGEQDTTCVLKYNETTSTVIYTDRIPGEKISKSERFARDTYKDAACDLGIIIQDESTGNDIIAVDVEKWKEVFYRRSAADNPNTLKSQFKRARTVLLEDKNILSKRYINSKEFYCLSKTDDNYGMGIMLAIRHRVSNESL